MRNAFIEALVEAAERDPDIWLINADLGFSVLERFQEHFPDRYLNVGVAEQNMIGVAAGLAMSGAKVFVYSIANFPTQRCLEQIRVDVCYHAAHVVVTAVGGGFAYGSQGYTHHAIEDFAVMRALPGMRVAAPIDPHETRAFVREFAEKPGPAYLRLGRGGEAALHASPLERAPLAAAVLREGGDVTLIGTGAILSEVLTAAQALERQGIFARVVALAALKPLDHDGVFEAIEGTDTVITIEEHSVIGGLRDTVAPLLAARRGAPRLVGFGVEDGQTRGVIKGQATMRIHCGIDCESLVERVAGVLRG